MTALNTKSLTNKQNMVVQSSNMVSLFLRYVKVIITKYAKRDEIHVDLHFIVRKDYLIIMSKRMGQKMFKRLLVDL